MPTANDPGAPIAQGARPIWEHFDPEVDRLMIRAGEFKNMCVEVAPLGASWFPHLCLVVAQSHWTNAREGPIVITDKKYRPLTAKNQEALIRKAVRRRLCVVEMQYRQDRK
jgi:hypothetical protein